jgi:hypothetical protein
LRALLEASADPLGLTGGAAHSILALHAPRAQPPPEAIMFTLIQTILQKHHKVVFSVLLFVIVVAFVFTIGNFNPTAIAGGDERPRDSIYGVQQGSREYQAVVNEAVFASQLTGRPISEQQLNQEVQTRISLLHLANVLRIPEASDKEIQDAIRQIPRFLDEQGNFSEKAYTDFLDAMKAQNENAGRALRSLLASQVRMRKTQDLLMGPGFVSDVEMREQHRLANQTSDLLAAVYNPRDATGDITPTTEELRAFYEDNPQQFAPPPRRKFDYIVLSPDRFRPDTVITDGQLRKHFNNNPDLFTPEGGETPAFEDVREQVRADMLERIARNEMESTARTLSNAVSNDNLKPGSDAFKERMIELGLEVRSLPPLTPQILREAVQAGARPDVTTDIEDPLAGTVFEGRNMRFARSLQQATQNRFVAFDMSLDEDTLAVVFDRGRKLYDPYPFNEVSDDVTAAYLEDRYRTLARERGSELRETIQARLDEGQSFREAAEKLGLPVESYSGVLNRQPERSLGLDPQTLFTLGIGELAPLRVTPDPETGEPEARLYYLLDKNEPEAFNGSTMLTQLRNRGRQQARMTTAQAVITDLIIAGRPRE